MLVRSLAARHVFNGRDEFGIIGRYLDRDGIVVVPLRPNVNTERDNDCFRLCHTVFYVADISSAMLQTWSVSPACCLRLLAAHVSITL